MLKEDLLKEVTEGTSPEELAKIRLVSLKRDLARNLVRNIAEHYTTSTEFDRETKKTIIALPISPTVISKTLVDQKERCQGCDLGCSDSLDLVEVLGKAILDALIQIEAEGATKRFSSLLKRKGGLNGRDI